MSKPRVPSSKVPTIGQAKEAESKEMLREFIKYLDPIIGNFGEAIELINKRLAVVEELKKIFPDNVNVTIKHEKPQIIAKDLTDFIVKRVIKEMAGGKKK